MEFLVGILILVLLVRWAVLSSRLRNIDRAMEEQAARSATRIRELTDRITVLENASRPVEAREPPIQAVTVQEPATPPPLPVRQPACQFCGRSVEPGAAVCICGAVLDARAAWQSKEQSTEQVAEPSIPPPLPEPEPAFASVAAPPMPPPVPRESMRERIRKRVGDQEWEAMVGGNWLNKAGVLLLVIGIALLLGYEFARVGPFGRVAIGLGVSLTLLIGGVLVERKPVYSIFARGLIGGGWAALYFTTYAMHAVEAAKVIENAYAATLLLLAVALGMILHSLRYRSQTVSGLAYFIAFATLALGDSTPFSVLALIPLAASLLFLAYRFEWTRMAVFGVVATYLTCASRPDTGAPLASTQALFGAYWLLFEAFDLIRLTRRVRGFTVESLILPLNTLGFLGLSLIKWDRSAHQHLYLALAAGGALYLLSALARIRLSPASPNESTLERIAAGGYEGPITISAALVAVSVFRKAPGMWINVGLLIEAEILFLAGIRFGQTYLRQLAGAVFVGSLAKFITDVPAGGTVVVAGRAWMKWTPVAILTAAVFYLNRAFKVAEGRLYSATAATLIVVVLGFETPQQYLCVSWLVFAVLLFEFGFRANLEEFRFQSYAVGVLGTGASLLLNVAADHPDWPRQWLPMAISAVLHYTIALRIRFGGRLKHRESTIVSWFASASATGLMMAIAWKLAPGDYLGVVWLALGAVLFELGLWNLPSHFRRLSYAVSATGFFNLFYLHVFLAHKGSPAAEPVSLGIAALLCYAISARLFRQMPDRIPDEERSWTRDLNAAAGTLFVLTVAWLKLPAPTVALAWAIVSLVLLELGFSFALSRFRLIGNLVAASVFGRLFLANFTDLGNTLRISHRMFTVVPIVISEYYVWARYRNAVTEKWEQNLSRLYLYAPAILAVVLMRFELGRSMAVVGWALLCLALYRTGLVKNIGDLRWQSYAIALLAFWRCWSTNFYIPESLAGIRGRILTGALVIACFYCAQLLSPRDSAAGHRLDRHSRAFFSLLASILLAVLLFYEVSGSLLTVAWGIEAVALLAAGFPLRDRLQRLSGLFLFLVCVLKLFLYDLRQLETINRILSFIVLGVILVSVSWIYTRFRDRIQRYL